VKTFRAEKCFPCLGWGLHSASRFRACSILSRPRRRKPLQPFPTRRRPTPAALSLLKPRGRADGRNGGPIAASGAPVAMSVGAHGMPLSRPRLRLPRRLLRRLLLRNSPFGRMAFLGTPHWGRLGRLAAATPTLRWMRAASSNPSSRQTSNCTPCASGSLAE
jgi:hypothetical protein